jgi:hypothetical protein
MEVGDTLKVADLGAIEGVEYLDDEDASIVSVIIPRIVEEEVVEPEAAEGEAVEGEEGPAGEEATGDEAEGAGEG